jgi:hypothetical protein
MAISSFDNLRTNNSMTGVLHKAAVISGQPDVTVSVDLSSFTIWTHGASGADTVNQMLQFIFVALGSATTRCDLSTTAGQTNPVGDLLAALTKIKYLFIEYLTLAQDSVNGTAATGTVLIEPSATFPIITSPLGAAQAFNMLPGQKWEYQSHDTTGITVAAGSADGLDFTNDAAVDANLRITILGNS